MDGRSLNAGPIHPMPDAPPRIIVVWLCKLAAGAAVGAGTLVAGLALTAVQTFVPLNGTPLTMLLAPLVAVLSAVAIWFITTAQPGSASPRHVLRWTARIGALVGVAAAMLWLAMQSGKIGVSHSGTGSGAAAVYITFSLLQLIGIVAFMEYLIFLMARMGDNFLRIAFVVLKWLVAFFLGSVIAWVGSSWQAVIELVILQHQVSTTGNLQERLWWLVFIAAVCGALAFLAWRLHRRLIAAARTLRKQTTPDGSSRT